MLFCLFLKKVRVSFFRLFLCLWIVSRLVSSWYGWKLLDSVLMMGIWVFVVIFLSFDCVYVCYMMVVIWCFSILVVFDGVFLLLSWLFVVEMISGELLRFVMFIVNEMWVCVEDLLKMIVIVCGLVRFLLVYWFFFSLRVRLRIFVCLVGVRLLF